MPLQDMVAWVTAASPAELGLLVIAGVGVIYAWAATADTVLGQPRDGDQFDENRTTKVKRAILVGLTALAAIGFVQIAGAV